MCKLMPNLRGPHESKRKLYVHVVQSVVMYGAPIWYEVWSKNLSVQRPLQRVQKQLACRVIAGYRTISFEVATLLARTPSWILVAGKQHRIYEEIKRAKLEKTWSKEIEEEFKEEEKKELQKI